MRGKVFRFLVYFGNSRQKEVLDEKSLDANEICLCGSHALALYSLRHARAGQVGVTDAYLRCSTWNKGLRAPPVSGA